jgi:hypothetical protein
VIFVLAQGTKQANDIIPWVIGLVVALLLLVGGAVLVRKWMLRGDSGTASDEGLMEGLRRARDEGKISQDEFDRTRKQIIANVKANMKTSESSTATLEAAKKRSAAGREEPRRDCKAKAACRPTETKVPHSDPADKIFLATALPCCPCRC